MIGLDEVGTVLYRGRKYALVIRDSWSRYTYCTILNHMTEFMPALKRFVAYVKNHHNAQLVQMHKSCAARVPICVGTMSMDRQGNHYLGEMSAWLKDRGTILEFVGQEASSHYQVGSLETVMYPNYR